MVYKQKHPIFFNEIGYFHKDFLLKFRACLNLECKILYSSFLKEARQVFDGIASYRSGAAFRKNLAQMYSKNSINKLQNEF